MTDIFDLLHVPQVALRQILAGVESADLFELIQCSTETQEKLQPFEKGNKTFKVGVDFSRNWVEIRGVQKFYAQEDKEGDTVEKTKKFDGEEVPISEAETKAFNTFWPAGEKQRGTKMIAQNFIKTLGVGTLDQIFIAETDPAHEILDWADQCNVVMENFNLVGAPQDQADDLANRIFSNDFMNKVKVNFTSLMEVSEEFQPTNFDTEKIITMNKLHLQHAHWFKPEHLKVMNVGTIILYNSTLASDEIHNFLAAWKAGSYNEFMYLSLHMKEENALNFEKIIKDFADPTAIDRTVNGRESIIFTRPSDGKEIELELEDNGKHFIAFVG